MILLTLPESLNKSFKPFGNCDFQYLTAIILHRPSATAERTNITLKTFDPLEDLPSINNFLPNDIIPTLIMENETFVKDLKTESLEKLCNMNTAKRKGDSPKKGKKKPKPSEDEEL
jgi:hypothetical protein